MFSRSRTALVAGLLAAVALLSACSSTSSTAPPSTASSCTVTAQTAAGVFHNASAVKTVQQALQNTKGGTVLTVSCDGVSIKVTIGGTTPPTTSPSTPSAVPTPTASATPSPSPSATEKVVADCSFQFIANYDWQKSGKLAVYQNPTDGVVTSSGNFVDQSYGTVQVFTMTAANLADLEAGQYGVVNQNPAHLSASC